MTPINETPARAGGARTGGCSLQDSRNSSANNPEKPAVQGQIAALRRDFDIEAARLEAIRYAWAASVKLRHLGENLALYDDVTAVRDRLQARENLAAMGFALARLEEALAASAEAAQQ